MSHFHITLNLRLGSEVIKVVISVNDYKQIRQRYLNGESQRSIAKSMGISRNTVKSTVKARMSLGSVKLPNVKHRYLLKMFLLSSIHASKRMKQKAWRNSDIPQNEFLIASLRKKGSKAVDLQSDVLSMRSAVRCRRHLYHFSSILLMRSRSTGVKPQSISMAKKLS